MARRIFSRELKVEVVRLVQERGVSIVQANRDLDLNDNVLRRWIREMSSDPGQAFPGREQMKTTSLKSRSYAGKSLSVSVQCTPCSTG
jgi:transposase